MYNDFQLYKFGPNGDFYIGVLPGDVLEQIDFDKLWRQHPDRYHVIHMPG